LGLIDVVLLSVLSLPAATEDACKVAVMPLTGQGIGKAQEHVLAIATETIATELASSTGCAVITENDITSMIDYEAQKQQCGVSSDSCMVELGSALGVDFMVTGTLGKIGDVYTLNSRLIDIERMQVVARVDETARNEGFVRVAARNAARGLFRLPRISEDEAQGDSFLLTRALVFGGIALGGSALVIALVGGAALAASIAATQTPTLPGELKAQALTTWAPLAGATLAVGIVGIPIGVTLAGLGYVLE
jgi:TolB-like protein